MTIGAGGAGPAAPAGPAGAAAALAPGAVLAQDADAAPMDAFAQMMTTILKPAAEAAAASTGPSYSAVIHAILPAAAGLQIAWLKACRGHLYCGAPAHHEAVAAITMGAGRPFAGTAAVRRWAELGGLALLEATTRSFSAIPLPVLGRRPRGHPGPPSAAPRRTRAWEASVPPRRRNARIQPRPGSTHRVTRLHCTRSGGRFGEAETRGRCLRSPRRRTPPHRATGGGVETQHITIRSEG